MIIIVHRLTTIHNADVIYEIVNGKSEMRSKEQVLGVKMEKGDSYESITEKK